jgi:DNA ligase 1
LFVASSKRSFGHGVKSRGEELMTERFPELERAANQLPDGIVLDGEIVGFRNGSILPFAHLQRRIGRKQLGKKILSDVPVAFLAFDLLELDGIDMRTAPLITRRAALERVLDQLLEQHSLTNASPPSGTLQLIVSPAGIAAPEKTSCSFQLPEVVKASSWDELIELRQTSRARHAEGLMLKRLDSPYRVGRPRGDWWKWKIEPYTIDAVLIYAQRGHGRRASLYTDYTFAVWDADALVPFAKAYSGLTDKEIQRVDSFVRRNTLERFGPVRSVRPELVFELAFENIQLSTRHKSGIAVRFPRILRWREDKTIHDADTVETIRAMLRTPESSESHGG